VGRLNRYFERGTSVRRILYIQFTDPAVYPPIEHSSRLLADRCWDVVLLGTDTFGNLQFELPVHPRIRMKKLRFVKARWRQKLQYFWFFLWALCWTCVWRPQWIYASDPFSLPIVWCIRKLTKARVIYHEHDSPSLDENSSLLMRWVLSYRGPLGREAELCVLPQQARLIKFIETTCRTGPVYCVWNCPQRDEVKNLDSDRDTGLILYYHGSINSVRVPSQLIVAATRLKGAVRLQIAGYEAPGSVGYVRELARLAAQNGVPELIEFFGTTPRRKELLRSAWKAHVGLSFMPKDSKDINELHMVGASNKPFDCMACGMPLLVTDMRDWVSTFVAPGYARACDPDDPDSIETQLRWYLEHPDQRREMGEKCRDKIQKDWNYETMFAPVLAHMEADKGSTDHCRIRAPMDIRGSLR